MPKINTKNSPWKHDELAEDLAVAKGGIPFLNVPLGSVLLKAMSRHAPKVGRADLIVCRPSYSRFMLSIYEIKKSRADFMSDIRSGKWMGYLPHCHRFYFAALDDVASKSDVPEEAGLIVRGPRGWKTVKMAPPLEHDIPQETLLALVFAKQRQTEREKRLSEVALIEKGAERRWGWNIDRYLNNVLARKLGKDITKLRVEAQGLPGGVKEAIRVLDGYRNRRRDFEEREQRNLIDASSIGEY